MAGRSTHLDIEEPRDAPRRPAGEWLDAVSRLYNPDVVPTLEASHVIAGLALLDDDLARSRGASRFLTDAESAISPDGAFDDVLSVEGLRLLRSRSPSDVTPTLTDSPARLDTLGRKAFAEVVAKRMRRIRSQDPKSPFRFHIHGPWGAGKTSLLNFLSDDLRRPPPDDPAADPGANGEGDDTAFRRRRSSRNRRQRWIVVSFNAWLHQHAGPPWWWLMNRTYKDGLRQLWGKNPLRALWLMASEWMWRFRRGRAPQVVAILLLAALAWWISLRGGREGLLQKSLEDLGKGAQAVSAITALVLTLWAGALGLSRFLLLRSRGAAEEFLKEGHDPMRAIRVHYRRLIQRLRRPVAVFIDDLDRCDSKYVVELLEGIQTLLFDAPVSYVVAADRRWLNSSFEHVYESFEDDIKEPGRPLGFLFLEKTFQLSASVPRMSEDVRESYLTSLLVQESGDGVRPPNPPILVLRWVRSLLWRPGVRSEEEGERRSIRESLLGKGEAEVIALGERSDNVIIRQEVAKRLEDPDLEASTQKRLEQFVHLLEPYPRAMKRLVNAYGIQRAIDIIQGGKLVDANILALWTILNLRWPLLAEYLENNPQMARRIGKNVTDKEVPDERVRDLLGDPEVKKLFDKSKSGLPGQLDEKAIEACGRLKTSESSSQGVA